MDFIIDRLIDYLKLNFVNETSCHMIVINKIDDFPEGYSLG